MTLNLNPDYEYQYELDRQKWTQPTFDNPESSIPEKIGTIDRADTGYIVVCTGFMGNESLSQQHYCNTVEDGIKWLIEHGCSRTINLVGE